MVPRGVVSDPLITSNLRVARSSRAGRAKRDGHFWVVRVSSRPSTVPELCPDCAPRGPVGDYGEHLPVLPLGPREPSVRQPASAGAESAPGPRPRAWSWPDLLRHTFAVDVLACPRCGGRMRVI